jgi:hypothetical protein
MKKIMLMGFMFFFIQFNVSCSATETTSIDDTDYTVPDWKCGTHNGNQLWTGPKGGCYYINSNGNKTYVDRSECYNCKAN